MKQFILTISFALMTLFVSAQLNVQMGLGATTQKYVAAEFSAGYNFGPVFLQTGYLASLTRNVNGGVYINGVVGRRLSLNDYWFVEPGAGYAYILKSSDRKELNSQAMFYTAGIGRVVNDGSLILKGAYCNRVGFVELVMRYNF